MHLYVLPLIAIQSIAAYGAQCVSYESNGEILVREKLFPDNTHIHIQQIGCAKLFHHWNQTGSTCLSVHNIYTTSSGDEPRHPDHSCGQLACRHRNVSCGTLYAIRACLHARQMHCWISVYCHILLIDHVQEIWITGMICQAYLRILD